jgi:signal transduction histidine kinase
MNYFVRLRRFFVASLIVSLTVPMVYHTVLNYMRRDYYTSLTKEVCKAVEPQVQMGSYRQPIEYAQGMMLRQGFGYTPDVSFFDHGAEITPHHKSRIGDVRIDCEFAGFPNVQMSVFYEMPSLLNVRYVYIYLWCIPIFFAGFIFIRMLFERFQRQVVDVVQAQIKRHMGLDGPNEKPRGFIGQLLDLNFPLLGYLKNHIDGLEERLAEYSRKVADQKRAEVLSDVAAQVAHDIVAPISALQEILTSSSRDEAQDRGLILEELDRLKALAEKMLRQYRGETQAPIAEHFDLTNLLSFISLEANALASGKCKVGSLAPSEPIFVSGVKSELSAALSNIVKNAIESIDRAPGYVEIRAEREGAAVKITIQDSGCGIPQENLSRVLEKDVSYKRGGTGLGLFQANSAITAMAGEIRLHSTVGKGTTVEIVLPVATAPIDFIFDVGADTHLVFVDDDKLVHEVWRKILPVDFPADRIHFFFSGDEFHSWLSGHQGTKSINFIDHDLSKNGGETGFELIERNQCRESSILLTGRAAEDSVKNVAKERGIRLVDKANQGKIRLRMEKDGTEIVLIDDARANRIAWSAQAKRAGRSLETFESADAFFARESRFDRRVPIYVDYFFDNVAQGGIIAERLIQAGFLNVFLATAYPQEKMSIPEGVRGVVGKEFPSDPPTGVTRR